LPVAYFTFGRAADALEAPRAAKLVLRNFFLLQYTYIIIINGPGPGLLYQTSQLQKRTTRPQEFNKKMPSDTEWPENTEQSFDQYETLYEFFHHQS
jgi:hypothetical protein